MTDYERYMADMQQDDGTLSDLDLLNAYAVGSEALRESVAGLTPQASVARPIPGKWSTLEVVAHLVGTEIYFADRIERTIALERPLLIGVDERPYPDRLGYQQLDLPEELDLFAALRRHVSRVLRMQSAESWQRTAVHSQTGLVTLRQIVFHSVRHLRHHLAFIEAKRAALGDMH
jgi:uncharacterized damage-inducible protein DinB